MITNIAIKYLLTTLCINRYCPYLRSVRMAYNGYRPYGSTDSRAKFIYVAKFIKIGLKLQMNLIYNISEGYIWYKLRNENKNYLNRIAATYWKSERKALTQILSETKTKRNMKRDTSLKEFKPIKFTSEIFQLVGKHKLNARFPVTFFYICMYLKHI